MNPLTRVVFVKNIIDYSVEEFRNLNPLMRVHPSWYETIEEYSEDIWTRCLTNVNIVVSISTMDFDFLDYTSLEDYGTIIEDDFPQKTLSIKGQIKLLEFLIHFYSIETFIHVLKHTILGELEWYKTIKEIVESCSLGENLAIDLIKKVFNYGTRVNIDDLLCECFSDRNYRLLPFLFSRSTSLPNRFVGLKPMTAVLGHMTIDCSNDMYQKGFELVCALLRNGAIPTVDDILIACNIPYTGFLYTLLGKVPKEDRTTMIDITRELRRTNHFS